MTDLWIFIVAPLVGAAIAAIVYTLLEPKEVEAAAEDAAEDKPASPAPAKNNNRKYNNKKKRR